MSAKDIIIDFTVADDVCNYGADLLNEAYLEKHRKYDKLADHGSLAATSE